MKKGIEYVNIFDGEKNNNIQITKEEFDKRFPTEKSYHHYLIQQTDLCTPKMSSNEITEVELLKLARFIYDDPNIDGIPILDIGVKIHCLNAKINHGIETSKVACEKLKQYNPEIPCPPYPANVFWAKLKDVKPLQFLEPSFNPTVSVEEAIEFGIAEQREVNTIWSNYKPLLSKTVPQPQDISLTAIELRNETQPAKDAKYFERVKQFIEIMNEDAAKKFALVEEKLESLKYIEDWKKGEDKKGLSILIHHLDKKNYFSKLRKSSRVKFKTVRLFFQNRYNGIDLKHSFRQHKNAGQEQFNGIVPNL